MSPTTVSLALPLLSPQIARALPWLGMGAAFRLLEANLARVVDPLVHRVPAIEQQGWELGPIRTSDVERAFGLLTQAPLSAEQASQERIWRRLRNPCSAASHTEMRDDDETWDSLERVKDWVFGDEVLEQRNCPYCGSTLARRKI
jgi:hypothetical protein